MKNKIILELQNISCYSSTNNKQLLKNISLTINEGDRIGIIGKSGSGKTTLCNVVAGIHNVINSGYCDGNIIFNNQKINLSVESNFPYKTAYVLQNPESQLFANNIFEEFEYGCPNISKEKIIFYLRLFDLDKIINKNIDELSIGQKQMLVIATYLTINPQIFILDEPANYLDNHYAAKLFSILESISTTQIIVEHNINRLTKHCNKIIEIDEGKIIRFDTTKNWLSKRKKYCQFSIKKKNESRLQTKSSQNIVSVNNLFFKYSKEDILKNITLNMYEGEIIAIIGSNGAGKTTLLKCLSGLLKPSQGFVAYDKCNKNLIGYVYQNPNYQIFEQSVFDECAYILKNHEEFKNEDLLIVDYFLKILKIKDRSADSPFILSYGEKRRLTIASLLVAKPKLLLLDEPSVALDIENLNILQKVFKKLAKEKTCVCFSTHDLEFASNIATRIICLDNGSIKYDINVAKWKRHINKKRNKMYE